MLVVRREQFSAFAYCGVGPNQISCPIHGLQPTIVVNGVITTINGLIINWVTGVISPQ